MELCSFNMNVTYRFVLCHRIVTPRSCLYVKKLLPVVEKKLLCCKTPAVIERLKPMLCTSFLLNYSVPTTFDDILLYQMRMTDLALLSFYENATSGFFFASSRNQKFCISGNPTLPSKTLPIL